MTLQEKIRQAPQLIRTRITYYAESTQKRFFLYTAVSHVDSFNEFDLHIPKETPLLARWFPDRMLWIFLISIAIKLVFFSYSIYMNERGLSTTIQSLFTKFGENWWNLEGLSDFRGDYILFRNNWINGERLYSEAFHGRYLYPPLYYYIINIFAYQTIYTAPIVMLICNCLTGFFVFHLAKNLGAQPLAAKAMMALTLLSPFNLFYSDFIWQNTGVFTTFVVLSMLEISREQFKWGMFWLGIAISVKQAAVFFLPIFVVGIAYKLYMKSKEKWMSKYTFLQYLYSIPWSAIIFYSLIPLEVFIFFSIPYLFTDPLTYLGYIFGSLGTFDYNWIHLIYSNIVPVYSGTTLIGYFPDLTLGDNPAFQVNYRSFLHVAVAWLGHQGGISTEIIVIFAVLFETQLLLLGAVGLIFLLYWRIIKTQRYRSDQEYYWVMWYTGMLSFFACLMFYKIGIYKYYFITLTPMWAMFDVLTPLSHKYWKESWKHTPMQIWHAPRFLRAQFFGGGSILHCIEQFVLQVILIYSNKWLAPLFFYLPMFLIAVCRLWAFGRPHKILF